MGQFVSSHGDVISHVNISSVRVADGGLYRCMAQNTAGQVHHSARLNVYGPPTIRHMGQLTAVAGETLSVTCPVGGHPVHKITWQKEGVELPMTHQQSVHSNGTLTIAAVTRAGDEGSYSCSAYDKQGRSDTQALQIQVIVPPRLAPVVFVGGTSAGLPAQATCIVLDGDPPITLRWLKDGHPINTAVAGVLLSQHSEITSTLSIERTSAQHSGNYTCAASNAATTTYSSATLIINMPPSWVQEPEDATVVQGETLQLLCSASGVPLPSVVWRKQTSSGNWKSIMSEDANSLANYDRAAMTMMGVTDRDSQSGLLRLRKRSTTAGIMQVRGQDVSMSPFRRENLLRPAAGGQESVGSSLKIVTATKEHQGRYSCEATNGIATGLSKLVTISVLTPPWFPSNSREVAVEIRGVAELQCRVQGDAPLTLHWRRAGHLLTLRSSKYKIEEEKDGEDTVLKLTLESAMATDSGEYECQASNIHGSNTQTHTLIVRDVPTAPSGLQLVQAGARALTLEWSAPGGLGNEMKVPSTMARLTGLSPATHYLVRVAAENSVGRSALSDPMAVTTLEEPPAGPPRNVKVVDISARSVALRWERPLKNLSNGAIRGYVLGYRQNSFSEQGTSMSYQYTAVPLQSTPQWIPPFLASPSSSVSADQTDTNLPSSGSSPSVAVGNLRTRGNVIEMTVEGLRPHSRYALVLQAYNSEGTGPSSPAITIVTDEDVPSSPPQNVTCEAVSSSELLVSWSPPAAEGINGRVTSYTVACERQEQRGLRRRKPFQTSGSRLGVEAGTAGCEVLVDDGLRARLASLKAFSNYSVTVAAATAVGGGVLSAPVLCTTAQGVPSAPVAVKAVLSSQGAAVVAWRAPDAPNGIISHYAVQWRAADGSGSVGRKEVLVPGDQLFTELTGIPTGSILEVIVRAHTAVGTGIASKPVTISYSDTVAAGVWSVGGPVSVAWKESVTLPCKAVGEPAPTRSWTRNGQALKQDSRVSVSNSGDLRLLDAQRSYSGSYTCTASNTHGSDSVAYLLRVISKCGLPAQGHYASVAATPARDGDDDLLRAPPVDRAGRRRCARHRRYPLLQVSINVTGATLYYRASGGATLEEQMTSDLHSVDNLRCGTLYHLFGTVRNSIGSSESSEVVEARTKGRTPEPPPQFQFITSNSTQATLYLTQWENGGCDITHFKVQYRKLHSAHWTTVSSEVGVVRTFAVGGLEPGERYEVRVTAYNSAGATPALYTVTTADLLHSAGEAYNSAGATPALYTVTTADLLHSAGEAYNSAGATSALYTVTTADLLYSAGEAYNSAGVTSALYTVTTTDLLYSAGEQQLLDQSNGYWTDPEDSSSRAVSAPDGAHWNGGGHRILLPLLLSLTTLLLAAFSVCFFLHKKRSTNRSDEGIKNYNPADPFTQRTDEDDKCAGIVLHHSHQQYDPARENVYHYVTSGYPFHNSGEGDGEREDRGQPPSLSPSAGNAIRGDRTNVMTPRAAPIKQKTFSSVLYKAPSLHEVDEASM
ncbi:Fibronectin type III, partial [Trinorchestia longiramus]